MRTYMYTHTYIYKGWIDCCFPLVLMKGEGKMVFMSKMKWVGLVGLFLSAISLFVHFLLARFTFGGISEYQSTITIFSRRSSIAQDFSTTVSTTTPIKISFFNIFHFSLSFQVLPQFFSKLKSFSPL